MYGINELKEALLPIFQFLNGYFKSNEDGKVDFADYMNFIPVLTSTLPAINGIGQVGKEILDADEDELAELRSYMEVNLQLPDKELQPLVIDVLIDYVRASGSTARVFAYARSKNAEPDTL